MFLERDPSEYNSADSFLVSTTKHLLCLDHNGNIYHVHSGSGLYYGLAVDDEHVYVACRNSIYGPQYEDIRRQERGSILVLCRSSFQVLKEIAPPLFDLRDVHGMALIDGKLWITCSYDNLIAVHDIAKGSWHKWYPSSDHSARGRDVNHFNSIAKIGTDICLLAHNFGSSEVLSFDSSDLQCSSILPLGNQAHDLFLVNEGLATCSSGDGILVNNKGWALRTGNFPRGLAFGANSTVLGLSQTVERSLRYGAIGILRQFDLSWMHIADYVLPGVGMVLAIAAIDARPSCCLALFSSVQKFKGSLNDVEAGNVYRASQVGAGDLQVWEMRNPKDQLAITVVINPGESTVRIVGMNRLSSPYSVAVSLDGQYLGSIRCAQTGNIVTNFQVPAQHGCQCRLFLTLCSSQTDTPTNTLGSLVAAECFAVDEISFQ